MVLIRDGQNHLEITVANRVPAIYSRPDEIELSVEVSSNGYSGHGSVWIEAPALTNFLDALDDLERRRQGVAELRGMSPEEFHLRFWNINRRGHIAVSGRLTKSVFLETPVPIFQSLEFVFRFDPTIFQKAVAELRALAYKPT
jgi:hypothetical protein